MQGQSSWLDSHQLIYVVSGPRAYIILFGIQLSPLWYILWGITQWIEIINIKCLNAKELFKMIKTFLLLIQGRFLMSSSNLGSKNTELRNPESVFEEIP